MKRKRFSEEQIPPLPLGAGRDEESKRSYHS
jgi:hypothetical protein